MSEWIKNLTRSEISAMRAYSSARSEVRDVTLYLDANENPYDSEQEGNLNRYPQQQPPLLMQSLSNLYQISEEKILATRGSDEGIDLLIRTFCRAYQDEILICPPTYGMYEVSATIQGINVVNAPLKNTTFELDMPVILSAMTPTVKLIFLCSPNNPVGNLLDKKNILSLCEIYAEKALIVVDEAYIEFSQVDSFAMEIDQYPNLVVLKTLSKAYGLAGVRCGSVIANGEIIQLLKKVIAPYPIPIPVVRSVIHALDEEFLIAIRERVNEIINQREKMYQFLEKLSFVEKNWPSKTNFLLIKVKDAKKILMQCYEKSIAIRDRSQLLNLQNCLRISIGTVDQNKRLMEILENVEA